MEGGTTMRRVLIVDDEPIIVNGLLSALEDSALDVDLYSAYSGEEALNILARTRMDIVISDMCMPGMDGLQLMNHIHADWPECRVIFLSGYSEFDMIYRAIQGEAVTFLLKTEGFGKIISTLRDTMDDLDQAQRQQEIQEKLAEQQAVTRQFFQREALTALIRGRSGAVSSAALEIDLEKPLLPLYAYIESGTLALSLEEFHEKLLIIDRALRLRLAAYPIRIAFWNHYEDILWLLQPGENMDVRRCALYIRENIDLIQEAVRKETDMTLAFALHTDAIPAKRLADAYQTLRRRVCQGVGVPGMIVLQPTPVRSAAGTPLLPDSLVGRLKGAMEHMNRQEYMSLLSAATDALRVSGAGASGMDDPYALEAFMTLSHLFLSYINRWKLHDDVQFPGGLSGLTSIAGFTSWDQAADAFMELGKALLRVSEGDQGNRSQAIVTQVCGYVERNLHRPEELSLSRMAEITYFNPAYLSRLFHQLTGETLSEYVSAARIRRANQLLQDSANKIGDIGEAVGFSSSANFSHFYKKMMGCTPQEYRESLVRGKLNKQ